MNDEQLVAVANAGANMIMRMYEANSVLELFKNAMNHFYDTLGKLKAKMKDAPLDSLVKISDTCNETKKTDPDFIPEKKVTLPDAAEREIHRRAFLAFTAVPSSKKKMNPYGLGFLRKPKY